MSASLPTVSVLMTTLNGGRYLAPAISSILGQTWRDLELVLVDNGSTDGAVDALIGASKDVRLRVFRQSHNLGIAQGTNFALAQSRGRLIAVIDHDDEALPERLARQVAWLEANPTHGGVAARTWLVDEAGRRLRPDFTLHTAEEHRIFTQFSQAANFGAHLFRREVVAAHPRRVVFPYSSDFDFISRVADSAPITALPEVLFHYRIHARQATQVHRCEQIAAECAVRLLTARRRAGQPEDLPSVAAWLTATSSAARDAAAVYRAWLANYHAASPLLTIYHARKLLSVARTPADAWTAIRHAWPALSGASDRRRLHHLFLRGPLRAFHLRPWPVYD